MILLAKLFGIYFKNLFTCIDEFVLQVPDILDILGSFFWYLLWSIMPLWKIAL